MIDPTQVKLGLRPRRLDRRTLVIGDYLAAVPPPPVPIRRAWSTKVASWGMHHNDRIGCCGPASIANLIECLSAWAGRPIVVPDDEVIRVYSAVDGYVPGNPLTDRGVVMLDLLKWLVKPGNQMAGCAFDAFVAVDMGNHQHLHGAVDLLGGTLGGLDLPKSAQYQKLWNAPWYGEVGPGRPGSWGGHAVYQPDYDEVEKGLAYATWNVLQPASEAWQDAYQFECYALLPAKASPLWSAGLLPSGFDYDQLLADLARVRAL